jgi:hypothetical protein
VDVDYIYVLSRVLVILDAVWIGELIYWIFTSCNYTNYNTFKIAVIITHKKFYYTCFNYSLLGNRSKQWLFLCKIFAICFLATDFNTNIMFSDIIHRPILSKNTVLFDFSKHNVSETGFCLRIGTIFIDWVQLSRFYLKTETGSSLRNAVF